MKQGKSQQDYGLAFTEQDDPEFEATSDDEEEACESAPRSLDLFPLPIEKTQSKNTFSTNELLMYE